HIGLYAAPAYLAALPALRSPSALADHQVVVSRDHSRGAARLRLQSAAGRQREEEVVVSPAFLASDYSTVQRVILAGGGIGPLPEIDAIEDLAQGRLHRVLENWHLGRATLYAITAQGREAPARVRSFVEFARTSLQKL